MEESEKRKERLKAMRTAAAEAESFDSNATLPGPSCLANPLNESSESLSIQEESAATPRFDYYTNPMAAFSGNKKSSAANPPQQNYSTPNHVHQKNREFPSSLGPRNLEPSLSPVHQWQPSFSPNQRPYQSHNPQQNFGPYQSPRGNFHQSHNPQQNFAPYQNPRGNFHHSPMNEGISPQGWNRPHGTPSFYQPPNAPPRGNNMQGPSFGHPGSPNFPRSPSFPSPSPSYSGNPNFPPRHGGSQWHGNSNFSQQGRGRGLGYHGRGPGTGRPWGPERFYDKSMVEDPWKDLSPVIWTPIESPPVSSGSWMPQSVRSKKPKVGNSPNKSSGGPSLAEFLAASFNETVSENETEAEDKCGC